MSRNLKTLGLALVSVFALSAMAASAAQGAAHHVSVAEAPAIVTASDSVNTVFSITGGEHEVECSTTKYEGTLSSTTNTETTVTPTYSGCHVDSVFGPSATIDVNHCAYLLKGVTDANGHATSGVECETGEEIKVTYSLFGSACTVDVTAQSPTQGVHYTQSGNNISISATVTGIAYHETGSGFCPAAHTGTDGTLSGTVLAKGFKEKATCSELTGTTRTTPGTHYTDCENGEQALTLNENVT